MTNYSIRVLGRNLCLLAVAGFFVAGAGHAENFSDWKNQQQSEFKQVKDEFEQYRDELNAAFAEYKRKTGAVWGRENVIPSGKRWVSYLDQLNQRSVVDFETGVIKVEVALPVDRSVSEGQAKKQLEQALLKAMKQGEDLRPMQQVAQQPVSQPSGEAVLVNQISQRDGSAASQQDYASLAQQAAASASRKNLTGDDGTTRQVYQAQLKLVPDHIRVRASQFQSLVNQYSAEYKIPSTVVFAVMETESMFNPVARSGAPAFGLMQLVPTSGARDAYRYVYKEDRVVSDTYLYNPENNVRLGTAYLRRLNSEYLIGITSDESRLFATIAAYNTGAGNVFRAFVGSSYSTSQYKNYNDYRKAALQEINKRTPEQVYQHLRANLPHEETRRYVQKVTESMGRYSSI